MNKEQLKFLITLTILIGIFAAIAISFDLNGFYLTNVLLGGMMYEIYTIKGKLK